MKPTINGSLRKNAILLLVLLIVQYMLGMYANLFVQFPDGAQGGPAWEFAWSQSALQLHIPLGILLFILSLIFLVRALRSDIKIWKLPAVLGFIGILIAGGAGALFITAQSDAYSYIMSLAFLLSFCAFGWGLIAPSASPTTTTR